MKKLYTWQGSNVLRNYTSGFAVVVATSREEAWEKLKELDYRAYYWLQHGVSHVYSEEEALFYDYDDRPKDWFAIEPVEHTLDTFSGRVFYGSE